MSYSYLENTEETSNDKEINQLSIEIAHLKSELFKKTELLKIKQVPNTFTCSSVIETITIELYVYSYLIKCVCK